MSNTIAAIATATGAGGIGIIRMSGDKCFEVLKKIFVPKNKNVDLDKVEDTGAVEVIQMDDPVAHRCIAHDVR